MIKLWVLFVRALILGLRLRYVLHRWRIVSYRIGLMCWIALDFRTWRDDCPMLTFVARISSRKGSRNYCSCLIIYKLIILEGGGEGRHRKGQSIPINPYSSSPFTYPMRQRVYYDQLSRSRVDVSSRLPCGSFQKSWLDSKMNLLSFLGIPSVVWGCPEPAWRGCGGTALEDSSP